MNSSNTWYLGTNESLSNGIASYDWYIDPNIYDNGSYTALCNITDDPDVYYNDTLNNQANTTIIVTAGAGWLEVSIITPPTIPGNSEANLSNGYVVGANRTFRINATVICRTSNCGIVNATIRYNKTSSLPDTAMPDSYSSNDAFYVMETSNPQTCGSLNVDQQCNVSFLVNSTGDLYSLWLIDVQFTGQSATTNDTDNVAIEISKVLIVNVTWDTINFGELDPLTTDNPAPGNANDEYIISVHNNSNYVDWVWIKGTNLTNGTQSNERIYVENMKWNKDTVKPYDPPSGRNNITLDYQLLQSGLDSGEEICTYYWIDVPGGIYAKTYTGFIYIMYNASL